MTINVTTLESNLTTKINATSGTTDAKEFLLLGKAVEAVNTAVANNSLQVANNLSDLNNTATAITNLGAAPIDSPALIGTPTAPTATAGTNTTQIATTAFVAGEVAGIVDSAPATLDTLNELAAALGDDANFSTTVTNSIATKLPLAGGTLTGALELHPSTNVSQIALTQSNVGANGDGWKLHSDGPNGGVLKIQRRSSGTDTTVMTVQTDGELVADGGVTVNGTLDIEEVFEKFGTFTGTSGTISLDVTDQGIYYGTTNQTANRTINFTNVNSSLAVGQSVTASILLTNGSTAYYLNAYQVDSTAVTPKWSGGSAPTAGNASGIDVYTFTIIKTADATFTVLASQTQYA
jgi:uncharacterized protein YdeI (BOF family)